MNSDDDNNKFEDNSRDADNFHIAPEVGEQGEGPGEQPVRRVDTPAEDIQRHAAPSMNSVRPGIDGVRPAPRSRTIEITEVVTEKRPSAGTPHGGRFNHGEEDVMQYFNTEETVERVDKAQEHTPVTAAAHTPVTEAAHTPVTEAAHTPVTEAAHTTTATESSKPAKRANLISTLAIILITVLVTAIAVFVILLITQDQSKDNTITQAPVTVEPVKTSSITCTKDGDEEFLKAANDAAKSKTTIIVNYADGDLEDYSEMTNYTYADATAAKDGLNTVRNAYNEQVADLNLGKDPFSSTYSQNGSATTVSHFAEASDLSFENMVLLNIPQTNGTNPDIDAIDKALTESGYSCKVKSAD